MKKTYSEIIDFIKKYYDITKSHSMMLTNEQRLDMTLADIMCVNDPDIIYSSKLFITAIFSSLIEYSKNHILCCKYTLFREPWRDPLNEYDSLWITYNSKSIRIKIDESIIYGKFKLEYNVEDLG